jgi:hypothetical protein
MSTALEKDIYAYLKTRKSIKFKVVLNIQGGPLVEIFLKRVKIGEFYEWDSEKREHIKIVIGTEAEVKLRDGIADFIHSKVFSYLAEYDYTEWDSFSGKFTLDDNQVFLEVVGIRKLFSSFNDYQ